MVLFNSICRAEDARLRTGEQFVNLIAVFTILAWRIFWMTMINRAAPGASPSLVLTDDEIMRLDRIGETSR
ncbi:MAG: hypothetical protein KGL21_01610 [Alphaproteobacteria bacterium]|nr:hypothetical protein [Alphaproteobacteria bacterium]